LLSETLQLVTSAGALIIGTGYLVGGLIVNAHLAQFGVTEYQAVRVKYLIVGLMYLFRLLMLALLTLLFVILIIIVEHSLFGQPWLNDTLPLIFTMLYLGEPVLSLGTFFLLSKDRHSSKVPQQGEKQHSLKDKFTILTIMSLILPIHVALQPSIINSFPAPSVSLIIITILTIMALLAQLTFYTRYLYGEPSSTIYGAIGNGSPKKIRLVTAEKNDAFLSQMGIVNDQPNLTQPVWLIDETDKHYIIGLNEMITGNVIKIDKDLVKAIVYSKSVGVNISDAKT